MTKTELEKLVTDLLAEVKALRGTVAEMKDAQARQEQMAEEARVRRIMEGAERLRKKALELADHKGKAADTPKLEEYVEQHNLENLRGLEDDILPALVARSFNPELAQAFAAHQMDMRLYKCVVRYFDVVSKAKPVEVTDELNITCNNVMHMKIQIFLKKINQSINNIDSLPLREIIHNCIRTIENITKSLTLTKNH